MRGPDYVYKKLRPREVTFLPPHQGAFPRGKGEEKMTRGPNQPRHKGLALGVLAAVLAAQRARSLRGRAARPARKTGGCRRLRLARRRKQLARRRTAWSRRLSSPSPSRRERVRRFVPLQRQALGLSAQAAHLRQDCFVSLRGKHSAWSAQAALLCQDWFREEDAGPIRRWNVIKRMRTSPPSAAP